MVTKMKINGLCEYMENPVGLDMENPRFFYNTDDNNVKIKSVQVTVSESKDFAEKDIIWRSEEMQVKKNFIRYAGPKLYSGVTYYWKADMVTESGAADGSEAAILPADIKKVSASEGKISSDIFSFTMGLLAPDSWQAGWIGGIKIDKSSYLYRHEWVNKKQVKHAAAFVASPCYNVVTINGKKASDAVLNNVFADYDKSLYYATYDITELVNRGCDRNAIGIMTGRGWHSLREAEDGIGWGDSLFSAQIRLEYADGEVEWILSSTEGWGYTTEGPIVYDSIYNGEVYDARREIPGWDCPGYGRECEVGNAVQEENAAGIRENGNAVQAGVSATAAGDSEKKSERFTAFEPVVEREAPDGILRSQMLEPIKVVREMPIKEIIEVGDGSFTIDFGKNSAGWVRLKLQGNAGDTITVKPAELINKDGSVNPITLRNAHPQDIYIMKGEGVEIYEPRFTYHGFRYAQIFGLKEKPAADTVTGCFVRSAVSRIGSFECDNEIINDFYAAVCQTEECNLHGVPTDCPQRDERLGWLNDMTVRNEAALYNYRLYQLYAKWLRDIRDTQGKTTGAVTDTAPFMRYGFRPADPVSASFLLLPWNLYLQYGDTSIIEENYEANARWVDYLKRNSRDLIVRFSSMGDWASPIGGTDHSSSGGGAISVITPQLLMSTGYLYYDCILMAKMAKAIKRTDDEKYYLELAEDVKKAFTREYYHANDKYYATNSQASNVLPLYFGMVDKADREAVLEQLCRDIMETHKGHLTTGNICTRYAMEVLFQNGREDLAWHLLTQTEYPSWGYMLKNGATTIWERWENVLENDLLAAMASLNHPMNGGAAVTLHKYLLGISPDEERPGFEHIIFRPIVPQKAQYAKASIQTIRGRVESSWRKENGELLYSVSVPFGCTASVYLPMAAGGCSAEPVQVGAGEHSWWSLGDGVDENGSSKVAEFAEKK
ncbi:MAG: glycoside hydrolase family 78 protein [Lachnospiraceae bacterium]|nr:glycoside hydrolase family 78 protein [Lachnospiraceae bacterium]